MNQLKPYLSQIQTLFTSRVLPALRSLNAVYTPRALPILAAVLIFLGVNLFSNALLGRFQVDLTQEGLYTLSSGTRNTLKELEEPITLHFFFSRKLANGYPDVTSYAERIRTLLSQYESLSHGKIRLQITDPEPFSDDEDMAVSFGLQGVDTESGEKIFFGLAATNSTDDVRVMPFFHRSREKFVEYELTRMIYELTSPKRPVVGIISTIPLSQNGQTWTVFEQMDALFDLNNLSPHSTTLPKDMSVLVLVHPQNFGDSLLYAIDQFVMRGGKLAVFVDPNAEGLGNASDAPHASDFNILLNKWGVQTFTHKVVADRNAAQKIGGGQGGNTSTVDYLPWLSMKPENFAEGDLLTADIKTLNFATAGFIEATPGATTHLEPLVQTSTHSGLIDTSEVMFAPDPEKILANFVPDEKRYTLVARVSGEFPSAFPTGNPGRSGEKALENYLAVSNGDAHILVVADTDMLRDDIWVQLQQFLGYKLLVPFADNGAFVLNALDQLSGNSNLISLRARRDSSHPFLVVEALRKKAEEKYLSRAEALKQHLQLAEQRLSSLQKQGQESNALSLSEAQKEEIQRFRAEVVNTRKELRGVQAELRRGIESLGSLLKFIILGFVPMLVVIFAVLALSFRASLFKVKIHD